jgi:hypothetical protein
MKTFEQSEKNLLNKSCGNPSFLDPSVGSVDHNRGHRYSWPSLVSIPSLIYALATCLKSNGSSGRLELSV